MSARWSSEISNKFEVIWSTLQATEAVCYIINTNTNIEEEQLAQTAQKAIAHTNTPT